MKILRVIEISPFKKKEKEKKKRQVADSTLKKKNQFMAQIQSFSCCRQLEPHDDFPEEAAG